MTRILLLDNYDSFTHNLQHYLEELGVEVDVFRNDQEFDESIYDGIVLSPGPGLPKDHPGLLSLIEQKAGNVPILGVCLGMQAIAQFLGGELGNREEVKHGVKEEITALKSGGLFNQLPSTFSVGLYHSWFVLPNENYSTDAVSSNEKTVMAISRSDLHLYGVQFHPESIMSEYGKEILLAFVQIKKGDHQIALKD